MHIGSKKWEMCIRNAAATLGIEINEGQLENFSRHAEELMLWNHRVNLTAIADPLQVALKHYVDAAAAAPLIPSGARMLDIGSGAGFPGMVLKLLMPSLEVTLIDAARKKVAFMQHMIRLFSLEKIDALHHRAEALHTHKSFSNRFEIVICRAFAALDRLVPMAWPFLASGGRIIALKGPLAEKEISILKQNKRPAFDAAGINFAVEIHPFCLPQLNERRVLVVIEAKPSF